jgi:serine/threonine-protein kinase
MYLCNLNNPFIYPHRTLLYQRTGVKKGKIGVVRHTKFGRYELLHKMAAGGMAEIFLARQWGQAGFFRDVVIKRLFPYFAENPHVLRLFQDEARLLAELSHPNIPQVFDLGQTDGFWYIAMEHVGGFSLGDVCLAASKQAKLLPLGVSVGVITQLCSALHHAHERCDREGRSLRIVHCDVTPRNVMVTPDGVVKVFDFGVARSAAREEAEAGVVRGTYAYMAPEQVRGKALDKRADVFAAGVILYELTTGERLFKGNDAQIMTAVVERDAPTPSSIVQNYPRELEQIALAALQRDRGKRTPSAAHLLLGLEQFCLNNGLVASPLVISRYMRSIFPYERAREIGMGMVPPTADIEEERPKKTQRSSRTPTDHLRDEDISAEELEGRLLIQELRRLNLSSIPPEEGYREEPPEPIVLPDAETAEDFLEFDGSELLAANSSKVGTTVHDPIRTTEDFEQIGLEEFDEEEVRPVVLLSPKPKTSEQQSKLDGNFMRELERRLEQEAEKKTDRPPEESFARDDNLIKER